MPRDHFKIDRRSFIKAGAPCALSFYSIARAQVPVERGRFSEEDIPWVRTKLLAQLNSERTERGLGQLELDDLACQVATSHALDMSRGEFLSHWGSDGRKPFHRFSFAGGIDAIQENVSATNNIPSVTPLAVMKELSERHGAMLAETPPNDGHRRTILFPYHTHVGFGVALNGRNLRLDEIYTARYVKVNPLPQHATLNTRMSLIGKLLNPKHFLHGVDICYEPLPTPPDIQWLRTPRPVSLPEDFIRLRPKAPGGTIYVDGTTGDYDWNREGDFRVPVKFYKRQAGIYTIVLWLRRVPADKAFPVTNICIRVE